MFVAAGAGAILYLLTYRLKPLWVRDGAASPGPRAQNPTATTGS
ncbi:hypothetical protein OHB00_07835 [Streptomyces sp. NBC_00631]